jgi:hypothetical protein
MKNVETTFRMVTACVLTSVTLAAVIVALGAGSGDDSRAQANRSVTVEGVVSRVRIINFDDTIARFDSSTGAIAKYNGNLQNTSVRGTWKPHVEGVRNTSGLLEIQEAQGPGNFPGATFLVDIVSGKTWQLNRRGTNATWDAVELTN